MCLMLAESSEFPLCPIVRLNDKLSPCNNCRTCSIARASSKNRLRNLPKNALHWRRVLQQWFSAWTTCFYAMTEIKLKRGEPVEKAIRRLKKKLDREQTLQQFRMRRRFEKPSARRRRKEKAVRFSAMLKARYAED